MKLFIVSIIILSLFGKTNALFFNLFGSNCCCCQPQKPACPPGCVPGSAPSTSYAAPPSLTSYAAPPPASSYAAPPPSSGYVAPSGPSYVGPQVGPSYAGSQPSTGYVGPSGPSGPVGGGYAVSGPISAPYAQQGPIGGPVSVPTQSVTYNEQGLAPTPIVTPSGGYGDQGSATSGGYFEQGTGQISTKEEIKQSTATGGSYGGSRKI